MAMAEQQLSPSWDGSVVLDIGGDIGALVLLVSADLDRHEIDLRPETPGQPNTHSAVRERRLESSSTFAAVYPSLLAGRYTIVGTSQQITISGGEVTETRLDPGALPHDAAHSESHHHAADGHHHPHEERDSAAR
jgi:hypothetical protein